MFSRRTLQYIISLFSSPIVLFYGLPWMMVLLVIGTIAQKQLGLYAATKLYLTAPVFWLWDIVPLPGMPMIIAIIFVNLIGKLLLKSPWSAKNAGIIITHFGAVFLFLGMMLTSVFSYEGYISLAEGESSAEISDYYKRILTLRDQNNTSLLDRPYNTIKDNTVFTSDDLPFDIHVLDMCHNCTMEAYTGDAEDRHTLAQKVSLKAIPLEKTEETNLSGMMVRIDGTQTNQDGVYVVFEPLPNPPQITIGEQTYSLEIQRVKTALPFSLQLVDVERTLYPGSTTPKSYHSDIRLQDGDVTWTTRIAMNEPLRYKGYTFYQSGYTLHGENEFTTLAAVKNMGRSFPYIAGLFLCIGMIIHAVSLFREKYKAKRGQDAV